MYSATALLLWPALAAGTPSFEVRVDVSKAPELAGIVAEARTLCEEWYPKINGILYGPDRPLPYREILVLFEPQKNKGGQKGTFTLDGTAKDNVIHMPSDWLKEGKWDFRPLLVHELTHVVQHYRLYMRCNGLRGIGCVLKTRFSSENPGLHWLTEGMATFVTETYYQKTNEPALRLDSHGYLTGYDETKQQLFSLQQREVKLGKKGYRHGYTVASAFLLWLEQRKDKDVIRKLNVAMSHGRAKPAVFESCCGAPLDKLWREFLATSPRPASTKSAAAFPSAPGRPGRSASSAAPAGGLSLR